MLIKNRYSAWDVLLWTRLEVVYFLLYAGAITALYVVAGYEFLQLPWAPIAVVGTAVAFIVGFQNNAAYGRIWEARKIWGGIVNSSRTFGVRVVDFVGPQDERSSADAEAVRDEHRILIYRHLAWLTALRHAMRAPRKWEVAHLHQTNREWSQCVPERCGVVEAELGPFLDADEHGRVVARTNRPAALLFEQSRHLRELKERGWIWEFSFLELQGTLKDLFDQQGKSERIKNFPYPRQYATLSLYFVRLFCLLVPFAAIPEFESVAETLQETAGWGRNFVWAAVPFSAMMAWIFHIMERIGRVGENPFEGTPNDVPISTIARGIEVDLRELLGEGPEQMPEPLPEIRDVQM